MEDEDGRAVPTERDRRIVKLLTRGVPIGRIAERLGIGADTVYRRLRKVHEQYLKNSR